MSFWIKFGALYTPCMREDTEVTKYLLQQREAECGADQGEDGFNSDCAASDGFEGYSCCVLGIPGDNRTDIRITDPVQCKEDFFGGFFRGVGSFHPCSGVHELSCGVAMV